MGKESPPPATLHLISVNDLAKHLNVKPGALYRQIREHNMREEQGVFQVLPGQRGLRIDEYVFLNWRRMPVSVLGDAHVSEVTKALLAMLYPMRQAIDQAIVSCSRMYDDSSQRVQDGMADQGYANGEDDDRQDP